MRVSKINKIVNAIDLSEFQNQNLNKILTIKQTNEEN